MKKVILISMLAFLALTACKTQTGQSVFGGTNSFRFKNPKVSIVGNTITVTADDWYHNWPFPDAPTLPPTK